MVTVFASSKTVTVAWPKTQDPCCQFRNWTEEGLPALQLLADVMSVAGDGGAAQSGLANYLSARKLKLLTYSLAATGREKERRMLWLIWQLGGICSAAIFVAATVDLRNEPKCVLTKITPFSSESRTF